MGAKYLYLQKRVTELRRFLLPSKFDPTGLYSDRIHQRTAAFRLLVHAEFESFLEDLVTAHASECHDNWINRNKPSITLAALLAYDENEVRPPTSLLDPQQKASNHFNDRLNSAVNRFQGKVRVRNHGVRETNVLSMLLPIGIDALTLDTSWLLDLDNWAQERGAIAHQSSGKVQFQLDPAREYSRVKSLLAGFKVVEAAVMRLP
ncbi:HEPN domain-containing protein [Mycobacterium intracellulare]|uniref:HEPN domain-containing protein n=1 Tax=Mycobacterium intracellulare TaxID=1767 RepID=UPI003556B033